MLPLMACTTCVAFNTPHARPLVRPLAREPVMTAPPVDIPWGIVAVAGVACGSVAIGLGSGTSWDANVDGTGISGPLQDRIRSRASTAAPTYRQVDAVEPSALTEEAEEETRQRKERERRMARAMLREVQEDYEEALEAALMNDDYEAADEYKALLREIAMPLPPTVVQTSDKPDFKKWLDPDTLR